MLLGRGNLNTIEVLISKALNDSYINHDKFVSVNNVLREYFEMKKKSWNFCGIYYINKADISRRTDERNGIERMVDNDGVLWLNGKYIVGGLDHKNLWEITTKYHSNHIKHRYELVEEPKK